ncbi:MAG: hypothetical protein HC915_13970, partial [Anaerolineae bacterium]|nr:hypothetical protein [Anaerolineae bacterium]
MFNNLMAVALSAQIIWEGEIDFRPGVEHYRAMVSQVPVDELVPILSDWNAYRFFMRMQTVGPMLDYLKRRRTARQAGQPKRTYRPLNSQQRQSRRVYRPRLLRG